MNPNSYIIQCDDADPESQCTYSAEGSSVDETYQDYMKHVKSRHTEKYKALSPEELKKFEAGLRKRFGTPT